MRLAVKKVKKRLSTRGCTLCCTTEHERVPLHAARLPTEAESVIYEAIGRFKANSPSLASRSNSFRKLFEFSVALNLELSMNFRSTDFRSIRSTRKLGWISVDVGNLVRNP